MIGCSRFDRRHTTTDVLDAQSQCQQTFVAGSILSMQTHADVTGSAVECSEMSALGNVTGVGWIHYRPGTGWLSYCTGSSWIWPQWSEFAWAC